MSGVREGARVAVRLHGSFADSDESPTTVSFVRLRSTRRIPTMEWIRRAFRSEIHESHVGIALILCLLVMAAMSIALLWQAQIIANQRDDLHLPQQLKLGN